MTTPDVLGLRALGEHVARLRNLTAALPTHVADSSIAADIDLIRAQAGRAATIVENTVAYASDEGALGVELHRLNNVLTGIISLAALCAEDAAPHSELAGVTTQMHEIEQVGRTFAQAVRSLSRPM